VRSTNRYRNYYDQSPNMSGASTGSGSRQRSQLVLFEKKVNEADAYLQLIIDQTTKIERKIDELDSEEDKAKYSSLQMQANAMLDNIKHSIVLLQIAKVNACH